MPFHDVSSSDSVFEATADSIINTSTSVDTLTPSGSNNSDENRQLKQSPPTKTISILYTDYRSRLPKLDYLRLLASAQNPHIIAVTETWPDSTISDKELMVPGYQITRGDRDRHGGGIALYVQDHLRFDVTLSHSSAELLVIELSLK